MDTSKELIIKILNVFENDSQSPNTDFSSIYIYADGTKNRRQVTLGRGFSECGGSLWMVFEEYDSNGGKNGEKLNSYKKKSCTATLPEDKEFLALIHDSCDEKAMRSAQDTIYDRVYWSHGEQWFDQNGFTLPLSMAVIQDSYLQSGEILDFLRKRFDERTPKDGGDEKEWITQYINTRNSWLENHSRKILRNTTYRTHFFQKQIANSNWDLDKFPIVANGVRLSS